MDVDNHLLLDIATKYFSCWQICASRAGGSCGETMQLRSTSLMRGLSGDLVDTKRPQPVIAKLAESLILRFLCFA